MRDPQQIPVMRYQKGGDIYRQLQHDYGTPHANNIATAARANQHALTKAFIDVRRACNYRKRSS